MSDEKHYPDNGSPAPFEVVRRPGHRYMGLFQILTGKEEPLPDSERGAQKFVAHPWGSQTVSIGRAKKLSQKLHHRSDLSQSCWEPKGGRMDVHGSGRNRDTIRSRYDQRVTLTANPNLQSFRSRYLSMQKTRLHQENRKYEEYLQHQLDEKKRRLRQHYQAQNADIQAKKRILAEEITAKETELDHKFESRRLWLEKGPLDGFDTDPYGFGELEPPGSASEIPLGKSPGGGETSNRRTRTRRAAPFGDSEYM
ncbi:hypothetical protein AAMO2058_000319500 [Amorphochlora amoebiformis]|uniref:Uncharacterized protein n=1 Tax=Amorphochlora amoebiformis TaxID=1561963 RepID=A0A7S0DTH0_9EUKA